MKERTDIAIDVTTALGTEIGAIPTEATRTGAIIVAKADAMTPTGHLVATGSSLMIVAQEGTHMKPLAEEENGEVVVDVIEKDPRRHPKRNASRHLTLQMLRLCLIASAG